MISEKLKTGRNNARHSRDLARELGCSMGTLTLQITAERKRGIPICMTGSGPRTGFYLAADPEDLRDYCSRQGGNAAADPQPDERNAKQ